MKVFLLTISLGSLLAVAVFGTMADWNPYYMSIHGWMALGLCTVLSLAIGGGLMALVFHSAHKGYDDRISVETPPSDPE
jgi:hypothetical protein